MKRGPSVLPPACPSKRLAKTRRGGEEEEEEEKRGAFMNPFPSATALFSPDVSSKMASDLLIRLSEATQKARAQPGSGVEGPEGVRGGQQDEPGLALSPDGPGASPEPPSLSHTPESNGGAETLASDLLRKLAERQEVNGPSVRIKEEEEPMEVDSFTAFELTQTRPITGQASLLPQAAINHFTFKTEEGGSKTADSLQTGAKISDHGVFGIKNFYNSAPRMGTMFEVKVKQEDCEVSGAKMVDQLLSNTKIDDLLKPKVPEPRFNGAKKRSGFLPGVDLSRRNVIKTEEPLFFGAKMEEQFGTGAKMADQCLRAVLWQDMSVNLASTLLHQLSERVSKSNTQMVERTPTPVRTSPPLVLKIEPSCSTPPLTTNQPLPETSLRRDQTTGGTYFYRCHVCGFETEGRSLFHSHMTEHRQWEHGLFSLHCYACDLSTNQEPEMKAHVDTHLHLDAQTLSRCPPTPPAVAVETAPEPGAHRCRICQRSFPGQQELLVHFQGHRQGNQYRCDRCGHLTRTANKLVEHVRVHTGERPFTCALCPYSAKRRDSLRLHCKVKHPTAVHALTAHVHANGLVHSNSPLVHAQRLLTPLPPPPLAPLPSPLDQPQWRDLSPLLPITVLLNIRSRPSDHTDQSKPRPSNLLDQSESSPSSASSCKRSYMRYLGLSSL